MHLQIMDKKQERIIVIKLVRNFGAKKFFNLLFIIPIKVSVIFLWECWIIAFMFLLFVYYHVQQLMDCDHAGASPDVYAA